MTAGVEPGPAESIDDVLALYERWGSDHYDEAISQLDHALQTAALAVRAGAAEPLVAAALLHDVGHLLELDAGGSWAGADAVDHDHESVGARYLAPLFPPAVTAPIALHVRAKRYRSAVDPAYLAALSAGSTASLALQGGPFTAAEAAAFEANPGFGPAVELRGWDDEGKVEDLDVPPLAHYRALLGRVAT